MSPPDRTIPVLVLLGLILLGSPGGWLRAEDGEPQGRLVWTQYDGSKFSLHTTVYGPDGQPIQGGMDLPVTPPESTVQVDSTRMISLHGTPLEKTASVEDDAPRGEIHFLHPAYDFTGSRMLWAGGPTWGPEGFPDTLGAIRAGSVLYFGDPVDPVTQLDVSRGQAMDAFPFADNQARWVYFSRFFYQGGGDVDLPGWYLMRIAREPLDGGGIQTPEFVESDRGKVLGSQPFLDATGSYLLYIKPDHRNVGTDLWYMRVEGGGDSFGAETKLWEAEGQASFSAPTQSSDKISWLEYSEVLGKARIGHPVMSTDHDVVVFASDLGDPSRPDQPGSWNLYALEVTDDGTSLSPGSAQRLEEASEDDVDETWPTISGDGAWVAFCRKTRDSGKPEIKLLKIRNSSGDIDPRGEIRDHKTYNDQGGMWPRWNQDEDPPHLLVKVQVSDGSPPLLLRLTDQEPDASAEVDAMHMELRFATYHPLVPASGSPPSDLPPLDFRLPVHPPPGELLHHSRRAQRDPHRVPPQADREQLPAAAGRGPGDRGLEGLRQAARERGTGPGQPGHRGPGHPPEERQGDGSGLLGEHPGLGPGAGPGQPVASGAPGRGLPGPGHLLRGPPGRGDPDVREGPPLPAGPDRQDRAPLPGPPGTRPDHCGERPPGDLLVGGGGPGFGARGEPDRDQ